MTSNLRDSSSAHGAIRALLAAVRARWNRLGWLRAVRRIAVAAVVVLAAGLLLTLVAGVLEWPSAAALALPAMAVGLAVSFWLGLRRVEPSPDDCRVARFIEEQHPELDDRLVSAVGLLNADEQDAPAFAASVLADAAHRIAAIEPAAVVSDDSMRRGIVHAVAACLTVVLVVVLGRDLLRQGFDATSMAVRGGAVAVNDAAADDEAETRTPRVERVDVEYTYPTGLGLDPRVDENGGDIFAPAGTNVRLRVHTSGDPVSGRLTLADGQTVDLSPDGRVWSGGLDVVKDSTYRIALASAAGGVHPGETEYFIRILDDRPPDIRILRPARDREVTRLEEVDVEVQARDDFGVERLELVYSVAGRPERVVGLRVPAGATTVDAAHTLYLEDLDVAPGDFIAYHVRASDRAAGRPAARSDIYFLQVRPFEQEFRLAQSQSSGGGGVPNRSIDDLVNAQKEIIVATWKLDRRGDAAAASSAQDVRTVARAEAELKTRVEAAGSGLRTTTMRDPRRGPAGGVAPAQEDAMTAAALALGRAVDALNRIDTGRAIPAEMEALTHLLKAQEDAGERQVTQQASGAGGGNRTSQDLSGLFDRELQRLQQTNYETRSSAQQNTDREASALDEIRELARRQDELRRRQEELSRQREMAADARRRALEELTRDQNRLREQTEQLAQRLGQEQQGRQGGPAGRGRQGGQERREGQDGRTAAEQMRAASDEMRNAASDLRREDAAQAAARGGRALERLRDVAEQMERTQPDERRRAVGEMQLEAQQIADAERQVASELSASGGRASDEEQRRLTGEQQRLAERASRLQEELNRQAGATGNQTDAGRALQEAARDASRELERSQLVERMREAAANPQSGTGAAQQEFARALDRVADRLETARLSGDQDAQRMTAQLSRAQALRDRLDQVSRDLERLDREARTGRGGSAPAGDLSALRDQMTREMESARQLLKELAQDDASLGRDGQGFTFEGQGMILSAPGTEAFKQDFARWETLRQQMTQVLGRAESSLAARIQARTSGDRLSSGGEDRAPDAYQDPADRYFRALAAGRKP